MVTLLTLAFSIGRLLKPGGAFTWPGVQSGAMTGSPRSCGQTKVAAAAVLYMGLVWVALVVGGRALSRAIASATGEDKPE